MYKIKYICKIKIFGNTAHFRYVRIESPYNLTAKVVIWGAKGGFIKLHVSLSGRSQNLFREMEMHDTLNMILIVIRIRNYP